MIGLRSRPILLLRGREGHGVIPLLVAKGYELLDVRRGAETVLGKGNRGMGRPLGSAARQDDCSRRQVSPTPNRPRTITRRARSNVPSRTRPAPPRGVGRTCLMF